MGTQCQNDPRHLTETLTARERTPTRELRNNCFKLLKQLCLNMKTWIRKCQNVFRFACFAEEVRPLRAHLTGCRIKVGNSNMKLFSKYISREQTVLRFRMVGTGMVYELSELKRKPSSGWLPSFEVVRAPLNEKLDKIWVTNYVIIHPKYLESLISTSKWDFHHLRGFH